MFSLSQSVSIVSVVGNSLQVHCAEVRECDDSEKHSAFIEYSKIGGVVTFVQKGLHQEEVVRGQFLKGSASVIEGDVVIVAEKK